MAVLVVCFNTMASPVMAQEAKPQSQILFTNANVFDGVSDKLEPSQPFHASPKGLYPDNTLRVILIVSSART
jgi:hypothetical protein